MVSVEKRGDRGAFSDISLSKWSHLSGVNSDGSQIIPIEPATDCNPSLPKAKDVDSEASITLSLLAFEAAISGAKIVDADSVDFGRHIGTGASMQVYEGRHGGKAVALKVIRAQGRDEFLRSLAAMRLELKFLLSDNIRQHPNIVKVLGFTWQEEYGPLRDDGFFIKPILLVELASPENSTLEALMGRLRIDDFATKASLISDIVQGLDAVHSDFLIHGDLKPENVLIFASQAPSKTPERFEYVAKLSDFGYSDDAEVRSTSRRWNLAGTEYWAPPECFTSAQLDEDKMSAVRSASRDLYCLGLIIWYIIASELPLGHDRGPAWSTKRRHILEYKKNGKVEEMASSFVRNCLSPLRPVADIAPDVLQISSLNPWWILQSLGSGQGDVQVQAEIAADGELMEWLTQVSEGVVLPDTGDFSESMVRNRGWRQLMERGYEWVCPEHPRSSRLLQKIDLRDSSHSMARFILVDQLLFRGKLIWTMNGTPCRGYLPHAAARFPRLLSVRPADRGTVREWLQYLQISPKRVPSPISSWRPNTQSSLRGGWSEASERIGNKFSLPRGLQDGYLSSRMRSSLNQQTRRDSEAGANAPDSTIIDFMMAAVADSTTSGSASHFPQYAFPRTPYRDISIRSGALSLHIAGEALWPSYPFDDAVVSEYCTENLCIHLYAFEKESGSHPVDDSFSLLMKDAIGSVDEAARKRIPRLWYDVYSKPERIQGLKITTCHAVARPKRRDEPGFNPEEAELAMGIRRDDVLAFRDAHQSGRLLADIDPTTESGANTLFILMIELHLKNILCFCLEEGLVDLEASINGFTPLQWSVKKGTWTAAATLLDLGANVSVLFHNTFVEEVITFGSQRSINILYFVQAVASSFPHMCHIRESAEHVKDFDFNEKRFKTLPTDGEPSSSAIHLAIFENAWTTFAALLSLGADIEKPCCKSMNPLQWAVGLLRPIFVGALIDAGANPNVRATDTLETPLHELVQLDTTRWPNRWIYGDSQALRAPDDTRKDDQTHADIILELLLRAPTIDKEVRNDKGATPFLAACRAGNVRMCRRLASAEANPLATMPDGRGALHLAVEATDSGLVDYLCREWPEMMKMEDCEHRTPLSAAVDSSASEILAVMLLPPPVTPCAEVSESSAFRILGTAQQDFGALEILFGHYEAADPGSIIKALNDRDAGKNVSGPQNRDIQVKGLKSPKANIVETCATPPVTATSTAPNIEARHCGRSDSSVSAYVTTGASTETTSLLSSLDGYRIRQCITASSALFLNPCTGLASRIVQDEIT